MKVLAIDPGFGRCGMAVLTKERGKESYLYSACIETSTTLSFEDRLVAVAEECARLIQTHQPDAVVLERLYFSTNQKTAMQVAEVRGALLFVARSAKLPIFEYTPAQVKSATTGWGRSDKRAVALMMRRLLRLEKEIEHDDEYDAIAIGLTHLASTR